MDICFMTLFFISVLNAYSSAATLKNNDCHECIHYNFERDFNSLFSNGHLCTGLQTWTEGIYASANVGPPNEYSQAFISPRSQLSCTVSFPFIMSGGGTVNVRVYMDSDSSAQDQIYVLAEQRTYNGINPTVGFGVLSSTDHSFRRGWQTLTFNIMGSTMFDGQLIFMGLSSYRSIVIVDAFCFKPSNYEKECWVNDYATTTTVQPETTVTTTTTTTTASSTTSVVTSSPSTTESTTLPAVTSTTTSTPPTQAPTVPTQAPTLPTQAPTLPTQAPTQGPTLPTQAPSDRTCPADGSTIRLPHETDCNLFYYCVLGEKILQYCPPGLHFNYESQVCDWPYNAGCLSAKVFQ